MGKNNGGNTRIIISRTGGGLAPLADHEIKDTPPGVGLLGCSAERVDAQDRIDGTRSQPSEAGTR